ncbi:glycosyltransferase family 4 protein [Paenibacillus validus]|uniref:glycosyltransferase family 4 protein n=1 Tax=Paenibacillus validus TaxID=44253 RepID=UPI000FD6D6F6|nr:glycosyltransferase family 4 protein [Paenibacillus validus]MED4602840.1 glycosyltransferase family 4 protein [Paenibacillus validus]MED4607318.1 glycosyltransferase family 4 protein [Paenibacillus validus]
MNIALCHFRVGETDGVSLEMEKWKKVLEELGHRVYLLAGSLGEEEGIVLEELHYQHPVNNKFVANAYDRLSDYPDAEAFREDVLAFAARIEEALCRAIDEYKLDMLVPNNIWSLGWGLPAGIAFAEVARKRNIACIAHNHDFHWERTRYSNPTDACISDWLEQYFPPKLPNVKQVVINKIAQEELLKRTGQPSTVVPNVFDFTAPAWTLDDYNGDFRKVIGVKDNDILFLQATRIAERKAIELAIDLAAEVGKPDNMKLLKESPLYDGRMLGDDGEIVLVLAGLQEASAAYVEGLNRRAERQKVKLLYINEWIEATRVTRNGKKLYSLWDAYVHADFITYPSVLEGWGNQFLEGLYAKKPMAVYEYPVYGTDIKPCGFHIVSLGSEHTVDEEGLVHVESKVMEAAGREVLRYLQDGEFRSARMEHNFRLGEERYSYDALKQILAGLFKTPVSKS